LERNSDLENTLAAAAVYYTGSSPRKISAVFNALNIHYMSESCYYNKVKSKLQLNLIQTWKEQQYNLIDAKESFVLAGDMRADSPGMFM
jgi:hypothetical protein